MKKNKLKRFLVQSIEEQSQHIANTFGAGNVAKQLGSTLSLEIKKKPKPSMGRALVRCGGTFAGCLDESSEEASRAERVKKQSVKAK